MAVSTATSLLESEKNNEDACKIIQDGLQNISSVSQLLLPNGPKALHLLDPLVNALKSSNSSIQKSSLISLMCLAKCASNREVIISATELSGDSIENLWLIGSIENGIFRKYLLILLYRLSGYKLKPCDLFELNNKTTNTNTTLTSSITMIVYTIKQIFEMKDEEIELYQAAANTLSQLALPDTYFNENQTLSSSSAMNNNDNESMNEGKGNNKTLSYAFDGDDIAINLLNNQFSNGINSLIKSIISSQCLHFISKFISYSLSKYQNQNQINHQVQAQEGGNEDGAFHNIESLDTIMIPTLCLIHNILLFCSANQSLFRHHLCEISLVITSVQFLNLRLDHYNSLNIMKNESSYHGTAGKAILLGIRCLAVASFKLKHHRQLICESGIIRRLLVPGRLKTLFQCYEPSEAILGSCIAASVKLHVNIEGGFGPSWELQHRDMVNDLITLGDSLGPSGLVALAKSLAGGDAIPVNRASRAYPACAQLFNHAANCCPVESLEASCNPNEKKKKNRNRNKNKNRNDNRNPQKGKISIGNKKNPNTSNSRAAEEKSSPTISTDSSISQHKLLSHHQDNEPSSSSSSSKSSSFDSPPQIKDESNKSSASFASSKKEDRFGENSGVSESKNDMSSESIHQNEDMKEHNDDNEDEDDDDDEVEEDEVELASNILEHNNDSSDPIGVVPGDRQTGRFGWVGTDRYLNSRPWCPRTLPPL